MRESRPAADLRVAGIRKSFDGAPALEDVSLDFLPGGFNTLLGPSGCGKTTLLRIVAGFLAPDAGQVLVRGEDRTQQPPWRRNIGFVFQSYALWPHLSVFENLAYGLRLRGIASGPLGERVRRTLGAVGLEGMGDRRPGQLSGGQQQRVALARALVLEPDLLLLDEPLSNLDARLRAEMRSEIRRLQREVGTTTVYVTHDQEEALEMSDRVAVFGRGRVLQVGSPEQVYRRPRTAEIATFLGATQVIEGVVVEGGLRVGAALWPIETSQPLGARVGLALRPSDVEVEPAQPGLAPDPGALSGTAADVSYLGAAWRVSARLGEALILTGHASSAVQPGDPVRVAIRAFAVVGD